MTKNNQQSDAKEFAARKPRRNERCACGSGKKFKYCHGAEQNNINWRKPAYIDSGESPIRWVIVNRVGTSFFSDKDNRILVFKSRADANSVAMMDEFADQEPGDINVGGIGPAKWQHLQDTLPFIEVENVEHGQDLVIARIEFAMQQYAAAEAEAVAEEPQAPENES